MRKDTVNIIISSLTGLLVGAAAALLIAPMEGRETRRRIKDQTRFAGGKMKDTGMQMRDRVQEGGRRAAAQIGKAREAMSSRARGATEEVVDETLIITAQMPPLAEGEKIDLNQANREDLMRIPGVGPHTADDIIQYRDEHGEFESVDDLDNVPGFGSATAGKIKDMVFT